MNRVRDAGNTYSKLVAGKRVKALFSETGELAYLEIDGSIFEGVGDFAPVPLWRLRRLKLGEIPEQVLIQPVEAIDGNVVYALNLGRRASFEVKFGKGFAVVEYSEWPQDWESGIGFYPFFSSLAAILENLEEMNLVRDLYADFTDELFTISFTLPLSPDLTVLKALKLLRRFISELEEEAEYRAALIALREARSVVARRKRRAGKSFKSRLSRVFEEMSGHSRKRSR